MALNHRALSRADCWMQNVQHQVQQLPLPSLQLVGALVARESTLPVSVRSWVITLLGRRIDMSTVSPAAEAVLRICEFKRYPSDPLARQEVQVQMALLRSLQLVDALEQASLFLQKLISQYVDYVTHDGGGVAEPSEHNAKGQKSG